MRWTAVVNPAAGRGRVRRMLPSLGEALAAVPSLDALHVSTSLTDAEAVASGAAALGHGLVACGGDGTVAALAGIAAAHDVPLAVVPVGAGNDFARTLGFDAKRPLDSVAMLAGGLVVEVRCDLGRANGTVFTSVANTGFDAEANRWANGVRHLRGTVLYVAALLRTLVVYRPHAFRLTVDGGEPEEHRAWLLAIGNGSTYAGGMRIAPGASLTDGLLDVTVVGPVGRAEFLRSFPRVFKGTHVEHPAVATRRGRRIEIASLESGGAMEIYASGERIGPLPATLEALPGALRVMVPKGSPLSER